MAWSRREFLKTGILSGAGLVLTNCATGPTPPPTTPDPTPPDPTPPDPTPPDPTPKRAIRRDVSTLDPNSDILAAYKAAIVKMKELPDTDPRNWTRQAQIHNQFCPHGNWLFLPWHRGYLTYFERICRKLSGMPDFALPYWDWSQNPSLPEVFLGDESNPLFIANRRVQPGQTLPPSAVGPAVLDTILNEENFLLFASGAIGATADQHDFASYGPLEGTPHNTVHGFIGGAMGNFMSPLDPIFWLHHNMIERCWVDWNLERGHSNTDDPAWTGRAFNEFCDEDGNPVSFDVQSGLLLPTTAYEYDSPIARPGGAPRAPIARTAANDTRLKRGAKTQFEFVRRVPATRAIAATLTAPGSTQVSLGNERGGRLAEPNQRNILVLDGVDLAHTEDFYVHVFLNNPKASASTSTDDPSFAGSFAFFGHAHAGKPATGKYLLDIGPTLTRLGVTSGNLGVSLVLVPYPNRTPNTKKLSVQKVELGVVDSRVVENPM